MLRASIPEVSFAAVRTNNEHPRANEYNKKEDSPKLPLVSIVVLNWNGEDVIRSSLESIEKLNYRNKEVIVVDNGSTDSSPAMISNEFPDFRLLRSSANLGFSAGMNLGIKASRGDFILLFNNDATAHPESLSELVRTAMTNPRIGMVGPLILYGEPSDVIWTSGGKLDLVTGTIWSDGLGKRIRVDSFRKALVTDIDFLSGCALLARKEVVDMIGLLDERSAIGGQDIDWCLKTRRAGFDCVLSLNAIIWHIGSHSSRQMPLWSYAQRLKSDFRVMILHFPLVALVPSLAFQLVITPFFELFFFRQSDISFLSRVEARLAGFGNNMRNLPELLALRKRIAALGSLRLKVRTKELLEFALFRAKSKEYYMGKFLQKAS